MDFDTKDLLNNLDTLHTTELGVKRIRKNLKKWDLDVVKWCKEKALKPNALIIRSGKNWYINVDHYEITINANSNTIITAHIVNNI